MALYVAAPLFQEIPPVDMIAHWRFDNGEGISPSDLIGDVRDYDTTLSLAECAALIA
jgi:hypothetical protein